MRKYLHLLFALSFIVSWSYVLSSCSDDDDEKKKEDVEVKKDDKAGYFWLKNLRTDEGAGISVINENGNSSYKESTHTIDCELGDTLVIKFTPKSSYTDEKIKFRPANILDNTSQVGDTVLTSSLSIGKHTLVAKAVCQMEGYNLSAQQSFSFKVKEKPVKRVVDAAGTFSITNRMTGEKVDENHNLVLAGDTLDISFSPLSGLEDKAFSHKYTLGSKVYDGDYVVVKNENDLVLSAEYEDSISYKAKRSFSLVISNRSTTIPYYIGVSPDLLKFVDVEATFYDSTGKADTYQIGENDWTKEYFYENEFSYRYRKTVRYLTWGLDCGLRIRYIPKDNVVPTEDHYDFLHSLSMGRMISSGTTDVGYQLQIYDGINVNLTINISIGGKEVDAGNVSRDDVKGYIDYIASHPEGISFHISEDGIITKNE